MRLDIIKTIFSRLNLFEKTSVPTTPASGIGSLWLRDDSTYGRKSIAYVGDDGIVKDLAEYSSIVNLFGKGSAYFGNGTDQYFYIPDNVNLQFGTFNFALIFPSLNLPDYTPSAAVTLVRKANTTDYLGFICTLETDGKPQIVFGNTSNFTTLAYKSTSAIDVADGSMMGLAVVVTRESTSAAGSVVFYQFGKETIKLLSSVSITSGAPQTVTETNKSALTFFQNINGSTEYAFTRFGGAYICNFAPSMAEIKDLMECGVPYRFKGSTQTDKVANGNMEGGFTGNVANSWTGIRGNYSDETIDVHSGSHSQGLTNPAGNTGVITQALSCTIGKRYRVDFWAKVKIGSGGRLQETIATNFATENITDANWTKHSVTFTATVSNPTLGFYANIDAGDGTNGILYDDVTCLQIGSNLELTPDSLGYYSCLDQSGNGMHGINSGSIPYGWNIGDRRVAYLLTTSTSPTMTDVQRGGWKVVSIAMETAENLTEIDATQETSSIEFISDKTLNNGKMVWSTLADHNLYAVGTDKDIVFKLTGNGGAGTKIYVTMEKVF